MATGGVAAETSNEPARCMQVHTQETVSYGKMPVYMMSWLPRYQQRRGIFVDTTGFDISSYFFQLISLN